MTDEQIRAVQARVRVVEGESVFLVYAWDLKVNDAIKWEGPLRTAQAASQAAFQMALDFPTRQVSVYKVMAVIRPDPSGAPEGQLTLIPGGRVA